MKASVRALAFALTFAVVAALNACGGRDWPTIEERVSDYATAHDTRFTYVACSAVSRHYGSKILCGVTTEFGKQVQLLCTLVECEKVEK